MAGGTRLELPDRIALLDERVVRGPDGDVPLTDIEARFLQRVAREPGEAVSRDALLVEVWGYSEDVVSRAVDSAVKRLRKKLEPDPAQPRWLVTAPGGYAWQGPAPTAPATGGALPRYHDPAFGREAERGKARAAIAAGARVVTLVGPGGAGKTRLAATIAAAEAEGGRPCWFAELAEARGPSELIDAVLAAFGVRAEAADRVNQLDAVLAGRAGLVVLDDVEHLADLAGSAVTRWLDLGPGLTWLVTSQVPLGARGEQVVRLGPLPPADAAALYVARARAAWPEADPESAAVAALVERLDGLPLAIELAASRAAVLGPAELLRRLDRGLSVLAAEGRRLEDALAASWAMLEPEDQRAIRELCAFRGGFTLEAAEAVLTDGPRAIDRIQGLARRSLVQVRPDRHGTRFALYQVVRAFAEEPGLDPDAVARHGRWFADQADRHVAAWLSEGRPDAMRWLRAERQNLDAVWERFADGDPDLATRALLADEAIGAVISDRDDTRIARLRQATAVVRDPVLRVRAELALAGRERIAGRTDASRARLAALVPEGGALPDPLLESERLGHIALSYGHDGDLALSEATWTRALALVDDRPRTHRYRQALLHLGQILRFRGDCDGAIALRARSAERSRILGDPSGLVWALVSIAATETGRGRQSEARAVLREALDQTDHPDCLVSRSVVTEVLGLASLEAGELDTAERWLTETRDVARIDGMAQAGNAIGLLGACQVDRGNLAAGIALQHEAEAFYARMGWRSYEAMFVGGIGIAALLDRRPAAAGTALRRAIGLLGTEDVGSHTFRLFLAVADAWAGLPDLPDVSALPIAAETPGILRELCAAAARRLGPGGGPVPDDRALLDRARDPDAGPEPGRSWDRGLSYVRWAARILEAGG